MCVCAHATLAKVFKHEIPIVPGTHQTHTHARTHVLRVISINSSCSLSLPSPPPSHPLTPMCVDRHTSPLTRSTQNTVVNAFVCSPHASDARVDCVRWHCVMIGRAGLAGLAEAEEMLQPGANVEHKIH